MFWEPLPEIVYAGYNTWMDIEIPTQTNDGMRLIYVYDFIAVKWDPRVFQNNWHHNESAFIAYMSNYLKPTVDSYMRGITEPDIELNGHTVAAALESLINQQIHPHPYLIHKPHAVADHLGYFMHVDNPQLSYDCYEMPGMCAALSSVGVPSADPSTEYHGNNPPAYLDRTRDVPDMHLDLIHTATLAPDVTMAPPSDYTPKTQEDVDRGMAKIVEQDRIAHQQAQYPVDTPSPTNILYNAGQTIQSVGK
jgi:hypothetical protein